jgi:phosphatidylglycerophosphatase A
MNPKTDAQQPKPRLALAIATAFGVGYLPKAPGTLGSLVGVLLTVLTLFVGTWPGPCGDNLPIYTRLSFLAAMGGLIIFISIAGVWAAGRVAAHLHIKDPQIVVVDEVSGQLISYLGFMTLPCFNLDWRSLLAGFILFRVFDIWKPFPIRRAESLPGGLGIMADDWIAGLYAALLLALARHLGL